MRSGGRRGPSLRGLGHVAGVRAPGSSGRSPRVRRARAALAARARVPLERGGWGSESRGVALLGAGRASTPFYLRGRLGAPSRPGWQARGARPHRALDLGFVLPGTTEARSTRPPDRARDPVTSPPRAPAGRASRDAACPLGGCAMTQGAARRAAAVADGGDAGSPGVVVFIRVHRGSQTGPAECRGRPSRGALRPECPRGAPSDPARAPCPGPRSAR